MGDEKAGKESRYPERRGEMEAGKTNEIATGHCIKSDLERVGEKNDRKKESETTDRERSKREVRGRKRQWKRK